LKSFTMGRTIKLRSSLKGGGHEIFELWFFS
jgi:hypothetical protein